MNEDHLSDGSLDKDAYRQARAQFRLVRDRLPPEALESVAREVVRRLAFRMPRNVAPDHLPTQEEIDKLCTALLSKDEFAGDRIIQAARRDGVPVDVIHLSYLAGAARHLGVLWDADRVSFAEVTLASSRLYQIIRALRHVIDRSRMPALDPRKVFMALIPGETHTLGIEIAANLFREAGWDASVSLGDDHDQLVAATEGDPFNAILLVAHTDRNIAQLVSLVLAMRITQPYTPIVIAGSILEYVEGVAELVAADAIITDVRHAVRDLDRIVAS